MSDIQPAELQLEKVMDTIRCAAQRRESVGSPTLTAAYEIIERVRRGDLSELIAEGLSTADNFTRMTASGLNRTDLANRDRYHVRDLVRYDDQEFVWNAYLALLKREPDETGFRSFLGLLRNRQRSKLEVLASLRYSAEGRRRKVKIYGLKSRALVHRFQRWARMWRRQAASTQQCE
jgi:Domain of unknown function (DUF4214)